MKNKKNEDLHELRNQALDIILEPQREEFQNSHKLESFDTHKAKVKQEVNAIYDEYVGHLNHGYEVIIEGLKKTIK